MARPQSFSGRLWCPDNNGDPQPVVFSLTLVDGLALVGLEPVPGGRRSPIESDHPEVLLFVQKVIDAGVAARDGLPAPACP